MSKAIRFNQRILAEAVRTYEETQAQVIDDPEAVSAAQAGGGDFERRLVARAEALNVAEPIKAALQQLRNVVALLIALTVAISALTGATTTHVSLWPLQDGQAINFFWLLVSILGLPTLTLLLWTALILTRPAFLSIGSIGGLIYTLAQRVSRRSQKRARKGEEAMSGIWASATVYGQTTVGTWTLSAVSHASWLAFTAGSLLTALVLLSVRQYSFVWETTILSADNYIALTRAIAALPSWLGFATPSQAQIAASRNVAGAMDAGAAWSGLLLGSVLVYGVLPRLLLFGLSLFLRYRAASRFRLDLEQPGYARWHDALMPLARNIGVVDREDRPDPLPTEPAAEARPLSITGPPALLGLEIDPPPHWPPSEAAWLDCGFVEDRADRERVLAELREADPAPRLLVIVVSLASTPDRGAKRFLQELHQSLDTPLALLLSQGQRLRERGEGEVLEQRVSDWRQLGKSVGIADARIIDLDFDHLTAASRAKLADLIGTDSRQRPPAQLEAAFALIVEHVVRWTAYPDEAAQAELHRAIADLYDSHDKSRSGQWLLPKPLDIKRDVTGQLQSGADRVIGLLPTRLRAQPRWLAAGALTGAMGCVALTALVSTAAIATLPLWAGTGAALALFARPKQTPAQAPPGKLDLTQPVSAAALLALLLELQGHSEAHITHILDRVIADDDTRIDGADSARRWLQELRQRFVAVEAAQAA